MLWVPITLFAAGAQVLRNGAQASLTGRIGTLGATQVRFVFGLPFATAFFLLSLVITGEDMPQVGQVGLLWALLGAVCQIAATGLMLYVMHRRAFGVAYAYIKTEPVIVALMGLILLGDRLSIVSWIAVFVVTAGVLITSVPPQDFRKLASERAMIAAEKAIDAGAAVAKQTGSAVRDAAADTADSAGDQARDIGADAAAE